MDDTAGIARRRLHTRPGWMRRIFASVVDLGASAALTFCAVWAGWIPLAHWWTHPPDLLPLDHVALTVWATPSVIVRDALLLSLIWVMWHGLWGVFAGRTPGFMVARLMVVDAHGLPASPLRALARAAGYLSWPLSLGLAIGAAWISRSGRGVPDLVARTWVVRARARRRQPRVTKVPREDATIAEVRLEGGAQRVLRSRTGAETPAER